MKRDKEADMRQAPFSEDDLEQIEAHGLTIEEVRRQLALFESDTPYLTLVAPCTPENGITVFTNEETEMLLDDFKSKKPSNSLVKFVPASGAASRMFKTLLRYINKEGNISKDVVKRETSAGDKNAEQLLQFMDGVERFAFFGELETILTKNGFDPEELITNGQFREIIYFLLEPEGLDYAHQPKALLKFHEYPSESRTAFEEHLVEGVYYIKDQTGNCALHFTVSEEHLADFKTLLDKVRPAYERRFEVHYQTGFSTQNASTDTLAVTLGNQPFRREDGRLLFRPGGHGALLHNLNRVNGDVIFIKNIDNVVPDHLKAETSKWKQVIGGYLLQLQAEIFSYLESLGSGKETSRFLDEVCAYFEERLRYPVPSAVKTASSSAKRFYLMERLNRPIRVCGMVKNAGEPGGGPFWVKDRDGGISRQIVEMAQVDPDAESQQEIVRTATHFNPVDLVCGVKDWQGNPFDLSRFTDPDAVFISLKSKDGQDLKALEHPGLWNGAMAQWITLFVEVPSITFNPVKTVNDLLRKEHQPG
jgi:hypothetical protein